MAELSLGDALEDLQRRKAAYDELKGNHPAPAVGPRVASSRAENEALVRANIENFVGMAQIPVGLAGPLLIRGSFAHGVFHVPLATTEGTLVASSSRGCRVIAMSGGCSACVAREGTVQRAPCLRFGSPRAALEAARLVEALPRAWLEAAVASKTSHGRLESVATSTFGSWLHVKVSINPGDAAGQNMVSVVAQEIVERWLREGGGAAALGVEDIFMEGGLSGEKTPTAMTLREGRGVSVCAWVDIPAEVLETVCRVKDPRDLERFQQLQAQGNISVGARLSCYSAANIVAAIFAATGQDLGSVSESSNNSQQLIRYDEARRVLRWEVQCFNLVLATHGGGTGLPTARECLRVLDCDGPGTKAKLAEVVAATVLANEISFWSAVVANEWVNAHAGLKSRM